MKKVPFVLGAMTLLGLALPFQNCARDLPDAVAGGMTTQSTQSPIDIPAPGPSPIPFSTNFGIVSNGAGGRNFGDGAYAATCNEYKNPASPHVYSGLTGDGTYTIDPDGFGAGVPINVYCDMTTDQGGWTMIANVPPAPNGHWESNATTYTTSTFPANDATLAMVPHTGVDSKIPNYMEVLFKDTGLSNWFVVPKTSAFYTNNYQGTCGDGGILMNRSFTVSRASNGASSLYAFWDRGCPNPGDRVHTSGNSCANIFLNFDSSCNPGAGTRIRAFIR